MIFSYLDNMERSARKDLRLKTGLSFLQSGVASALPPGRYDLGDGSVAIVATYETELADSKRFEAHRKYIDIQYVAMGAERIGHAFVPELLPDGDYDEEKDLIFFNEPAASSSLLMPAGTFAVFYPHDAHKPGLMAGDVPSTTRKIVVKVPVTKA